MCKCHCCPPLKRLFGDVLGMVQEAHEHRPCIHVHVPELEQRAQGAQQGEGPLLRPLEGPASSTAGNFHAEAEEGRHILHVAVVQL